MVLLSIKVVDFDCSGDGHQRSGEPGQALHPVGKAPDKCGKANKAKDDGFKNALLHGVCVLIDHSFAPIAEQILSKEAIAPVLKMMPRQCGFRDVPKGIPMNAQLTRSRRGCVTPRQCDLWFFRC